MISAAKRYAISEHLINNANCADKYNISLYGIISDYDKIYPLIGKFQNVFNIFSTSSTKISYEYYYLVPYFKHIIV